MRFNQKLLPVLLAYLIDFEQFEIVHAQAPVQMTKPFPTVIYPANKQMAKLVRIIMKLFKDRPEAVKRNVHGKSKNFNNMALVASAEELRAPYNFLKRFHFTEIWGQEMRRRNRRRQIEQNLDLTKN